MSAVIISHRNTALYTVLYRSVTLSDDGSRLERVYARICISRFSGRRLRRIAVTTHVTFARHDTPRTPTSYMRIAMIDDMNINMILLEYTYAAIELEMRTVYGIRITLLQYRQCTDYCTRRYSSLSDTVSSIISVG